MIAYSNDLRERVVRMKQEGVSSLSIAKLLKVSTRTVDRYWSRLSATGTINPNKIGGYRISLLEAHKSTLKLWIKARPEITVDEITKRCREDLNLKIARVAVWKMLDKFGLSYKKNSARKRARQGRRASKA